MDLAYRIWYENRKADKNRRGELWKWQIICAVILYGVLVVGSKHSAVMKQELREVFLPGEMEAIAVSFASGKSPRQVFIDQCRQAVEDALPYD